MFLASCNTISSIKFVYWILDLGIECNILTVVTMVMKYSNSRTFDDFLYRIPKLSRTYSVFNDFPGLGKMDIFLKNFQGLSVHNTQ